MTKAGNSVLHHFTGAVSLEDVSTERLRELVAEYPYSGALQFLLSAKLTASDPETAGLQHLTTALYFNDPFWLHFSLQATTEETQPEIPVAPPADIPQEESGELTPETGNVPGASLEAVEPVLSDNSPNDSTQESAADDTDFVPEEADSGPATESLQQLSRLIEQQLSEFQKPVEGGQELPIKSHPFFTIDYFASQGIRPEVLQQGKDNLTGKVKKFTDWLKEMKAINPKPADLGTDPETEKLIETIAETSNETKEIVTEAMADVLRKQGKTEKAIHLYQKLSFLNPSKSTYFAAKIEELKG